MEELCMDKYGYRVLSWILCPDDKRFFSPYERECLAIPSTTSVKAPETRRQEILRVVKPQILKVLVKNPLKVAAEAGASNLLRAYLAADWDGDIIEALIKACVKETE